MNVPYIGYYEYEYGTSQMFPYYARPLNYIYYLQPLPTTVSEQINNSFKEDIKTFEGKNQNLQEMQISQVPQQIKLQKKIPILCQTNIKNQKNPKNIVNPIKYSYKNTESNISNQIFSFLLHPVKSQSILVKILHKMNVNHPEKLIIFYHYMKIIKKRTKKYLNKNYLLSLCNFNSCHPSFRQISRNKKKLSILSLEEFAKIIRIMINFYLQNQCRLHVLMSKKIDHQTWISHLQRRRIIKRFLQKNTIS